VAVAAAAVAVVAVAAAVAKEGFMITTPVFDGLAAPHVDARPCKARTALLLVALALVACPALAQKSYASADAASEAFADALRRDDQQALRVVLGNDWKTFIPVGTIERSDVDAFLTGWEQTHKTNVQNSGKEAIVTIGNSGWTLPIPIVKGAEGWHFDPRAGADQMRTRRIGRNELDAMQAVLAYFDAQREYASKDRDNDGVLDYAEKFFSSPGKHDGLYWPDAPGQDPSPLGPLYAGPTAAGPGYHGYHFRILKAQGKNAPGGAYSYVIGGRMRAGFAVIAWPVRYGETGVMSFILSHDATMYERDLGPDTDATARAMQRFDPDPSWKKAQIP
jgi:Protein of unknown function (DUF2950)